MRCPTPEGSKGQCTSCQFCETEAGKETCRVDEVELDSREIAGYDEDYYEQFEDGEDY